MPLAENDALATIGAHGRRIWLYPQRIIGRFVRARTVVAWFLIVVLLASPWVDVGGHPALRFDIPARRFYFFGLSLFATDANYLLFLFGFVVLTVFLVSALFGRAWCGWACPQTVFLESLIRPVEEWIEGKPNDRRKLDNGPWTFTKIWKKGLKHGIFLAVSGMAATTLLAAFLGREGTLEAQFHPFTHPVGTGFFILFTGLLYFDFAWFREQTCVVVCPYGRFQSVLLDQDSLTVGYDVKRGEPRGKKGSTTGDCVDCKLCVQVCPTGIDIRNGSQMECVACTACIDACDSVMVKIGKPEGLIRYASERSLAGDTLKIFRPRVAIYAGLLGALTVAFAVVVGNRQPVEVAIIRMVGAPYTELDDGRVQNATNLRIANKDETVRHFTVTVVSPAGAQAVLAGAPTPVAPGAVVKVPMFLLQKDPGAFGGKSDIRLRVQDDQGFVQELSYPFLSRPQGGNKS